MVSNAEQSKNAARAATIDSGTRQQTALQRRRRMLGAAGSAGVLLAVQARSALGQTVCESPSAMMSGNTSPRDGETAPCAGGFSPGFWKQPQHFDEWQKAPAIPPTFTEPVSECLTGQKNLDVNIIATPGTLVSEVLPGASPTRKSGSGSLPVGIWEVLAFPNNFQSGQLMRHLIAAWFNAGAVDGYPLTQLQVQDMWSKVGYGQLYCPPGVTCTNGGMTADEVKSYIESLYDINTTFEKEMCTADDSSGKGSGSGNGSKKP